MILTGAFFVVSPSPVSAGQAGDYTYSIVNGSAVISAYTGTGGAITIPSSVGGYVVTGIGAYAFSNAAGFSVTSVIIPDSVTSIDTYAFDGCSSITSLTLGKGLLTIGNGAFEGCSGLTSVIIPNSVTRIGSWAFYSCIGLSTLTLGSGLVSIGDYAFYGCMSLESLTVPNNVVSIGTSAFDGCSSLISVVISNKVQTIGSFAFYDCRSLTTVTVGSGVVSLGSSMFYGCDQLTSITFFGLVAPTSVGSYWLPTNSFMIRGHAYAASNFPAPGNSFYGLMMDSTIDPAVPGAPTGPSATPSDSRIVLTWSAPISSGGSPVVDYKIYRGTASAGETYLGHTSSGNVRTYSDTGLTNGVTYYYKVTAVNSYGEGPRSGEVSARPSASLSAPLDLQITAGNGQAYLSWTMPSSIGSYPIDYYVVYQDGVDVIHPATTSATISGLNNGQTYSFSVAAHNSVGIGPRSVAVTTTPVTPKTVPGVPTGLTAVPGNGQIVLSWTAPVNDGGASIDYYLISVDGVVRTDHYAAKSATITGLTNGHQYGFTVAAHNMIGTGLQSAAVKSTPMAPLTVSGEPKNLTAMPGNGQVSLAWSVPSTDGGAAVDYYLVFVDGVVRTDHYTARIATITGLTNGHQYSFTVAAHNVIGISLQSSIVKSTPVAPVTVPGVPTGLAAGPGDGQVALTWNAPSIDGGVTIDYYVVYQDGVDVKHSTSTSATITGLTNGQTYSYSVAAHNSAGAGTRCPAVTTTPLTAKTVPGVSTGVTGNPGDGRVVLTWSAPANNGGTAIDYYLVYVDGAVRTDHYTTVTATVSGLTNGRSYSFTVAAHNVIGTGLKSSAVKSTPLAPITVPGAPKNLTATPGDGQVALAWSAPSTNGGAAIDYYLVYVDGVVRADHYALGSATIAGLANGRSYSFAVAAHNVVGASLQSTVITSSPKAPLIVPGAPGNLVATAGDGRVILSWSAPTTDGGVTIDYYLVYVDGVVRTDHYSAKSASIMGLTNGRAYSFTVAAHNVIGTGLQSTSVKATPTAPVTVPGVPRSLTAMPGDGQIALSWSAPIINGGANIDYYLVYMDGTARTDHYLTSPAIITGLTNGRSYSFTIAAHNSAGTGAQSAAVVSKSSSPLTVPGAPTGLKTTPGNAQVGLSWSAPISNGGSSIDYYLVYVDGVARSDHYSTSSATVSGLTNGRIYSFTIAAHNAVGIGAQSVAVTSRPLAPTTVPGAPIGLTAIAGNGLVALSWSAPASDGGAGIDYYLVYVDGVARTTHFTTKAATITGLTNGHQYSFTVAAHNAIGISTLSSALRSTPVTPATVPGVPIALMATAADGRVSLAWSAPSSNGGAAIDYYLVYVDGAVRTEHFTAKTAIITGLIDGRSYGFTVAAHNSVGTGSPSVAIIAKPAAAMTVPGILESGTGEANNPQVAMDKNGNAVVVWQQNDGAHNSIYARRNVAGTWGAVTLLETGTGEAWSPQVAMDSNGNAVVVWQQYDSTNHLSLYAKRLSAGAWGTVTLLETGTGDVWSPQVAMDSNGNAVVVWQQYDSTNHLSLYAKRLSAGTWGTVTLLETGSGSVWGPQVAMDNIGSTTVVWSQLDSSSHLSIYAKRFSAGSWGAVELLETGTGDASGPQVAMDNRGNAVVVWQQMDNANQVQSIYINDYASGAWGPAWLLERGAQKASGANVAMDSNGNVIVVFDQHTDALGDKTYAKRFSAGAWSASKLLASGQTQGKPQVAMDSNGNAMLIWGESDGSNSGAPNSIYAVRSTGGAWGPVILLETGAGNAKAPQLAMSGNGRAIAVWDQYDGVHESAYYQRL
jgi:hypothetical protein